MDYQLGTTGFVGNTIVILCDLHIQNILAGDFLLIIHIDRIQIELYGQTEYFQIDLSTKIFIELNLYSACTT